MIACLCACVHAGLPGPYSTTPNQKHNPAQLRGNREAETLTLAKASSNVFTASLYMSLPSFPTFRLPGKPCPFYPCLEVGSWGRVPAWEGLRSDYHPLPASRTYKLAQSHQHPLEVLGDLITQKGESVERMSTGLGIISF